MSYKILITVKNTIYKQTLFVKKWWGWKAVKCCYDTLPLPEKAIEWQKTYNIPDKRITFDFSNQ